MAFINKSNALFFYFAGIMFMIFTYFIMEPALHNSQAAHGNFADALAAYVKIFYALGIFFIVFGLFMFAISPCYSQKREFF